MKHLHTYLEKNKNKNVNFMHFPKKYGQLHHQNFPLSLINYYKVE
jgi:hypothetical protein